MEYLSLHPITTGRRDAASLESSMTSAFVPLLAILLSVPLSFSDRLTTRVAVERMRYGFVLNAEKPFDQVYDRKYFESIVRKEIDQEKVLRRVFGVEVTSRMLENEYQRIEVTTRDEEQWQAIKSVMADRPALIQEIVCRPLVVQRLLREKFDLDRTIHAEPHAKAREIRAQFLAGTKVGLAKVVRLSRVAEGGAPTDEMLRKARAEAEGPRVLTGPGEREREDRILPIDVHLGNVLTRELRKPGDVTTVLEHRDRFEVMRLVQIHPEYWKVELVTIPKLDFDTWFERARRNL